MDGYEIGYVRLKSGEELIGPMMVKYKKKKAKVIMQDAISFFLDTESGATIAKYWITYSDDRELVLTGDDLYYYGVANEQAVKFYAAFQQSVDERNNADDSVDEDDDERPHYLH